MPVKFFHVMLLFAAGSVYAQETTTYNTVSVELYQNFATPEFGQTFIPDWEREMLGDFGSYDIYQDFENQIDHSLFSMGGGICYERLLKNDMVIRPRIGLSYFQEKADSHVDRFSWNGVNDYEYISSFRLSKLSLNCFLGFGKKFFISKNSSVVAGVDIAALYQMNHSGFLSNLISIYQADDIQHGRWYHQHDFNLGNLLSLGVGPMLSPSFTFNNSLTASLEFQLFYLCRTSLSGDFKKITDESHMDAVMNAGYPLYTADFDTETLSTKRVDFEWSGLSTAIRIGYSF